MNISNYSFDDVQNSKKKIRIKPIYIILISLMVVVLGVLVFLYFGLKKDIEEDRKNPTSEEATTEVSIEGLKEEENFSKYLEASFRNMYGFSFEMYITGSNNDYSYLGEFLGDYFSRTTINEDLYITGMVHTGGAKFAIYKGKEAYDNGEVFIGVGINEEGTYANIYYLDYIAYPEDMENYTRMYNAPCKMVRLGDGMNGYEIMDSIYSALNSSEPNFKYGTSTNGNFAVNMPNGTLKATYGSPMESIINGLHGDLTAEINTTKNDEQMRCTTILCEGSDISFKITTEEFMFFNPPYENPLNYVSIEEYKASIGE